MSQDQEFDQNQVFEKYLAGKTDLSQLYAELPQVELPDHLDATILAEAHRAVNSRPGAKSKRRWTIPLGLVASLIVAVMVGLQLPYMLKDAALPLQLKEEKMAALMDKNIPEPASPAPAPVGAKQLKAKVNSGSMRSEPASGDIAGSAEGSMPARVNAPLLAAPAEDRPSGVTSVIVPPPLAAPAPASASKRMELRERGDAGNAEALAKEKKATGQTEGFFSDALQQHAPAANSATPQPAQARRPLLQATKDVAAGEDSLRAEDWLIRIKRLKQEGKLEEAKQELAAFKKRYPDYPVPAAFELK